MIPGVGRIVHYRLAEHDVMSINMRRGDALSSRIAHEKSGAMVHHGNPVSIGDVYPLIITRIWGEPSEESVVNGQVLLDGNDSLWVTSVKQGTADREWTDPRGA